MPTTSEHPLNLKTSCSSGRCPAATATALAGANWFAENGVIRHYRYLYIHLETTNGAYAAHFNENVFNAVPLFVTL